MAISNGPFSIPNWCQVWTQKSLSSCWHSFNLPPVRPSRAYLTYSCLVRFSNWTPGSWGQVKESPLLSSHMSTLGSVPFLLSFPPPNFLSPHRPPSKFSAHLQSLVGLSFPILILWIMRKLAQFQLHYWNLSHFSIFYYLFHFLKIQPRFSLFTHSFSV